MTLLILLFTLLQNYIQTGFDKFAQETVNLSNFEVQGTSTESTTFSTTTTKYYTVIKIIDGDTIEIETIGKVRLIGIDTPETKDPRKEVQCFGQEATNKITEIIGKGRVFIEYDESQGLTDKYGRTLVYIFLEDGTFINYEMIKQGYAFEYTYNKPYKYQSMFKEAQIDAQSNLNGLWGSCEY